MSSFWRFVARRVLVTAPVLFLVTLLGFVLTYLIAADPLAMVLSERAMANPEIVRAYRTRWGLDQPPHRRYLTYVGNLLSMLGAENALPNPPEGGPLPGFGVIDAGQAALLRPDIVLILPAGDGSLESRIRSDPAWAAAPAVRNGRVSVLDRMLFLRAPGPRIAEAIETLLELLYPAR